MSFSLLTNRIISKALAENIASSENGLTIRNVITHLDFDVDINNDKIVYTNKKGDEKVMLLYQLSYVPKDASPNANIQSVRRPYSFTVVKNDNIVLSIQTIQVPNQAFHPMVEISKHDKVSIIVEGYDGTANIYLFGLVAERFGTNTNS